MDRYKRYREKHKNDPEYKAKRAAQHKRWRAKNKEYLRKQSAAWHAAHKDDPEYKAMKTQNTLSYFKKYAGKVNAANAVRRIQRLKRVPLWLTQEHREEIIRIYENCPAGYEVDHIVPLQGATVSGLHVPWNLQYLLPSENAAKGNRFS